MTLLEVLNSQHLNPLFPSKKPLSVKYLLKRRKRSKVNGKRLILKVKKKLKKRRKRRKIRP